MTISHTEQPQCHVCGQASLCPFPSIATSGIVNQYRAGTDIIQQFTPNTGVHVVCAGAIAISETVPSQNSVILDIVSTGGILGIVECGLDLRRYHFSARALNDTVVTFFPLNDIRRQCSESAGEMRMLAAVSQALRQLEKRYLLLSIAEATDRLIATLLWLSRMDKIVSDHKAIIPFELTNTILSSLIRVRPETVTRLISQLRTEDLIEYSNGRLVIADQTALKARASIDLDRFIIDSMVS